MIDIASIQISHDGVVTNFEGEYGRVLQKASVFIQAELASRDSQRQENRAIDPWDARSLSLLLDHIAEGPRRVLREIASRPNGYPIGELEQKLGITSKDIGGQLGSIGRHANSLFPDKPKLIRRDPSLQNAFKMDESVASFITGQS